MSICGHLGNYNTATTRTHVRFMFSTHAAAGGNVAPSSAFEAADIRIYKATDGAAHSATQRSVANGITMTSPFDSLTGVHEVDIDLTENTDTGFYVAGFYTVVLAPDETIDSATITGIVLCTFEIGVPVVNTIQVGGTVQTAGDIGKLSALVFAQGTLGATGNTTTVLHLTGLTYADDEINGCMGVILDVSASEYHPFVIADWADTGDLATVTPINGTVLPFTPEASVDKYWLLPFHLPLIADAYLNRNVAGGSSAGRLVKHALAKLRNKWDIYDNAGTPTMRIYDTDDTTVLWEEALSTAASTSDVIAGADPS